jgi:hypothetical protein
MTDSQMRSLMLRFLYDTRKKPSSLRLRWFVPANREDLPAGMDQPECERICQQLADYDLINWEDHNVHSHGLRGDVRINALGVDVIEGNREAPISLVHIDQSSPAQQSHHRSVSASQGDQSAEDKSNEKQAITNAFEEIVNVVDKSSAFPSEKSEAKSLLLKLLESKAVSSGLGTDSGYLRHKLGG